jgi:hypothetical protein
MTLDVVHPWPRWVGSTFWTHARQQLAAADQQHLPDRLAAAVSSSSVPAVVVLLYLA